MRVSEIRVNQIRVNQGLGVCQVKMMTKKFTGDTRIAVIFGFLQEV